MISLDDSSCFDIMWEDCLLLVVGKSSSDSWNADLARSQPAKTVKQNQMIV
jgi:hypothetical protein